MLAFTLVDSLLWLVSGLSFLKLVAFLGNFTKVPAANSTAFLLHGGSVGERGFCQRETRACFDSSDCVGNCFESGFACLKGQCVSTEALTNNICKTENGCLYYLTAQTQTGEVSVRCYPNNAFFVNPGCAFRQPKICAHGELTDRNFLVRPPTREDCKFEEGEVLAWTTVSGEFPVTIHSKSIASNLARINSHVRIV